MALSKKGPKRPATRDLTLVLPDEELAYLKLAALEAETTPSLFLSTLVEQWLARPAVRKRIKKALK